MKKYCKFPLLMLLLLTALTTIAFASDYDNAAKELQSIGLFQGSDQGYELDRAPTRTEAAVMLVRLLGAEKDATDQYSAGTISHPFTDVADWASPYIAWLYQNKLTNGISDTLFGAGSTCNAQVYCTFLLRALGYSDASGGDFTYVDVLSFAESKGLYAPAVFDEDTFLRDHVAALSYQALAADRKGTELSLLESLIVDGAISAETAQPLLDKITVYRNYSSVCSAWADEPAKDITAEIAMNMSISDSAQSMDMDINMTSDIKTIVTEDALQLEATVTTESAGGYKATVNEWIQDGYLYMNDGTEQYKIPLDYSDIIQQMEEQSQYSDVSAEGLYLIDSITAAASSEGTLYTIKYSEFMSSYLDDLLSSFESEEISDISIDLFEYQILVGGDGMISTIRMNLGCSIAGESEGETFSLTIAYDIFCTVNDVGDDVTIDFPDFSDYPELEEEDEAEPEVSASTLSM